MPSDATQLAKAPLEWLFQGRKFLLAPCDIDIELTFQMRHEQWAFNRMAAVKHATSADAFRELMDLFLERQGGNEYAFGTPTSLKWLITEPGLFEYILLKFQKGQALYHSTAVTGEDLRKIQKFHPEAWADLKLRVLRADFPTPEGQGGAEGNAENPATSPAPGETGTPSSSPMGGPSPSTGGSSAFCEGPPGGCPEPRLAS